MEQIEQCSRASRGVAAVGVAAMVAGSLMSLVLLAGCDADRAEAVRHFNDGMAAFQADSSSQAAEHMERALEVDPTFHEAAYTLGQVQQRRLGEPGEAANRFRQALDQDPDNPDYAYRLASALAESEDHESAVDYFAKAVDLKPDYARAWFEKGMSLDALGDSRAAVDAYTEAIVQNPRLRMDEADIGGEHYHAMGDLYLRYRLNDHAVQVYENGVKNNPDSVRLHHGLAVALLEANRPAEAVDSFRAALELDEEHASANFNLAVALHEAGETDDAIDQLEMLQEAGHGLTEARARATQALLEELKFERDEE